MDRIEARVQDEMEAGFRKALKRTSRGRAAVPTASWQGYAGRMAIAGKDVVASNLVELTYISFGD